MLFYFGTPVVRTDGRSEGNQRVGVLSRDYQIFWDGWIYSTHGAPLARESSAKNGQFFLVFKVQTYLYEKGSTVMRARRRYPLA